ncbi:MAG TPA: hypothetical protein VHG51_18920 [Longimicrobiaceae bacterium]|nr:hypothetical protein [Longimicrobiaceae bacterium]
MSEHRFDDLLREAAREYNAPPPTPREEMWARIERARTLDELQRRRDLRSRQRLRWGAGIAAVLLMGIAIGRTLGPAGPGGPAPVAARVEAGAVQPLPYRVAATQHLSRAEVLLTSLRSEAAAGSVDDQTIRWAKDLLTTTRLLLDSRAARDPELRVLLQDLELVLAQIVQLPADTAPQGVAEQELDLVTEAIEQGDVLPRLRSAIPAGAPLATT